MFKVGDTVKLNDKYFENTKEDRTDTRNISNFKIISIYEGNENSVREKFPYFIQNLTPDLEWDMGLVSGDEIELV